MGMEFNETKKSHGGGQEGVVNPDISRVDQEQIDEEFNKRNPSVGKIRALLERRVRERFRRTACFRKRRPTPLETHVTRQHHILTRTILVDAGSFEISSSNSRSR